MHSVHFLKSLSQKKNKEICRLAVDFNDFKPIFLDKFSYYFGNKEN